MNPTFPVAPIVSSFILRCFFIQDIEHAINLSIHCVHNTKHLKKFLRRKKKGNQSMDQSELVGKTKAGGNEFFWIGRGAIKIAMSMD